ncbi:MAG: hypothetical protein DI527_19235 [Chelatococcus sp.]|nr:MAG: hypothetical protein DI527_19235 [Chelatococcus sp.]
MSSPENAVTVKSPIRRHLLLGLALGAAALAGGCFQPLYADYTLSKTGGSVKDALRSIEFPEIKGLMGHYLRNELVFELDGSGDPDATKRLRFETSLAENIEVITVDYLNARADSAVLVARADWRVTDIATSKVVSSGSNVVRMPYERSSQRFATVRAARDAQIRAAKNLATLIRGQIAADLART